MMQKLLVCSDSDSSLFVEGFLRNRAEDERETSKRGQNAAVQQPAAFSGLGVLPASCCAPCARARQPWFGRADAGEEKGPQEI